MSLTDIAVKNAKPRESGYKLSDGKGLHVTPAGSKLWHLKYRFAGKEKKFSLGGAEYRRQAKRAVQIAAANTCEAIVREWFTTFSPRWAKSHSSKVLLRLENDIFPWIGKRPIAEIEPYELLEVLQRIEDRGALDTGRPH